MRNIGILLFMIVFYCSCHSRYRDVELEDRIKDLPPNAPIVLNDIGDFDWDTMRIAGPYTLSERLNIKVIPRSLQKELDVLSRSDEECIIIFTCSGQVVKYAKVNRSIYDLSQYSNVFTRDDVIGK